MGVGQGPTGPFFSIFGVEARYGTETAKVIFDESEEVGTDHVGAEVLPHSRVIEVRAADFAALAVDEKLTIAGTRYVVHDIRLMDDGASRRVYIVPE